MTDTTREALNLEIRWRDELFSIHSDDVPGLHVCGETLDEALSSAAKAIPILLQLNDTPALAAANAEEAKPEPTAWIDDDDLRLLAKRDKRHYASVCNEQTAACKNPLYADLPVPMDAQPQLGGVRICPDRDAECGDFPRNWCADCPKNAQPVSGVVDEREAFNVWAKEYVAQDPANNWPLTDGHDDEERWALLGWQSRAALSSNQVNAAQPTDYRPKDMSEARRMIVQLRGRLDDLKAQSERDAGNVMMSAYALCPTEMPHPERMRWMADYFLKNLRPAAISKQSDN